MENLVENLFHCVRVGVWVVIPQPPKKEGKKDGEKKREKEGKKDTNPKPNPKPQPNPKPNPNSFALITFFLKVGKTPNRCLSGGLWGS